ncbi:MAG: flavodoxin domain-containing protein [Lachnospiraceae bacterium]|nr:hypothetical protein [Lachnospiraceae bacterium]MEE1342412.1 flavodoxin domain-containing protein [Lachnospiraceae bacterium]
MKKIIIYGSQYGTTKRYAEKLSELTGISVMSYEKIKDLSAYDEIIHFGGLYAGGVKGLKNTIKALPQNAQLIIVTVGLSDVTNTNNTDHIKKSIHQQVPQPILDRTKILHLRGGIDYSKLNFMHKTMMSLVYKKAKNTPEEEKTAEVRDMIETYNQKVDFTDFDSLQQVIEVI